MIERESLESDVAIARIVSSDVGRFLVNWRTTTARDARTWKETRIVSKRVSFWKNRLARFDFPDFYGFRRLVEASETKQIG